MNSETDITLTAMKFVSGDSGHVCRLCFSSTEKQEISIEDSVRLQRTYFDETVTFVDMFDDLGVTTEPLLPQVLCMDCAATIINSYLFHKLCQYSNSKWNEIITRLNDSLSQTDMLSPTVETVYLMINKKESIIFTSRKRYQKRDKRVALAKVKSIIKSRSNYIRAKEKDPSIVCDECDAKFKSKTLLAKHMKVHNKSKNNCRQCGKIFGTALQLEDHAERVHYPKKIRCPKCSKMFSTQRMLKYHDRMHHIAAICKLCFIQFPSKNTLRAHLDKHDVHKCPRCNKSFINKHTYKFHLKICGNAEEKLPRFFCDICQKGYVRKNGIRTHLKTDHGFGNVLSCNWCGKKFDAVSRLRNHIVKHTRERNFHCEQCNGKFVTRAALVYHTRLHTGERPFPCDLCSESFLSASRRMEHKRRKHFEPTKECHVCHVKFVTDHQLRKHVQRHYNPQSKLYIPDAEELPLTVRPVYEQ